jgi:hypothetical protein
MLRAAILVVCVASIARAASLPACCTFQRTELPTPFSAAPGSTDALGEVLELPYDVRIISAVLRQNRGQPYGTQPKSTPIAEISEPNPVDRNALHPVAERSLKTFSQREDAGSTLGLGLAGVAVLMAGQTRTLSVHAVLRQQMAVYLRMVREVGIGNSSYAMHIFGALQVSALFVPAVRTALSALSAALNSSSHPPNYPMWLSALALLSGLPAPWLSTDALCALTSP